MQIRNIQGAIFDMDGTLLDSMPVWEHASERYLQNKGIKVRERLSDILFSMSMQKGAEYVKENYHLAESVDEIVAGVNNIVYTAYEKEVQPKEGVRELLDTLQVNGIKMAVATSTDRPMVEALKRTGLFSYFEQIFTCTEVGKGKVAPDIYYAAADILGTEPKNTLVFEDALYAIGTAKKAGFVTVGVYDDASRKEQGKIKEQADIYLEGFVSAVESLQR
jgi:HAD superfamily hydrolase (TIGR01509 family)